MDFTGVIKPEPKVIKSGTNTINTSIFPLQSIGGYNLGSATPSPSSKTNPPGFFSSASSVRVPTRTHAMTASCRRAGKCDCARWTLTHWPSARHKRSTRRLVLRRGLSNYSCGRATCALLIRRTVMAYLCNIRLYGWTYRIL